MTLQIGKLYSYCSERDLWDRKPSGARVLLAKIPSDCPFLVLKKELDDSFKHSEFYDIKVLSSEGKVGWIYAYKEEMEEVS